MSSSNPINPVRPALAPPSGVTSNFVNPYSLSPAFIVTAVLCLLLATFAVIVRLATSFCGPSKRIRVEDCTFLFPFEIRSLSNVVVQSTLLTRARYMCYIMGRYIDLMSIYMELQPADSQRADGPSSHLRPHRSRDSKRPGAASVGRPQG